MERLGTSADGPTSRHLLEYLQKSLDVLRSENNEEKQAELTGEIRSGQESFPGQAAPLPPSQSQVMVSGLDSGAEPVHRTQGVAGNGNVP